MPEEGTLSIVRRGTVYQVRYASNNPYAPDRAPRACHDADTLVALLHHLGTELETIEQAYAAVQRGGVAVLRILLSSGQIQAFFRPSTSRERRTSMPVGKEGAPSQRPRPASLCTAQQRVEVCPCLHGEVRRRVCTGALCDTGKVWKAVVSLGDRAEGV